jgi:hypothetical protein
MDIANPRLNSTDATAIEFHSGRVKQRINARLREQIDSPRSRESVRIKSGPDPRVQSRSIFSAAAKAAGQCQNECPIAHRLERLSCSVLVRPVRPTRPANCPRPALHNLPRCVPATTSCGSRQEHIHSRARPDSTARCGRVVKYAIDSGPTRRRWLRPSASGRRQSDVARRIGSNQRLNAKGGTTAIGGLTSRDASPG